MSETSRKTNYLMLKKEKAKRNTNRYNRGVKTTYYDTVSGKDYIVDENEPYADGFRMMINRNHGHSEIHNLNKCKYRDCHGTNGGHPKVCHVCFPEVWNCIRNKATLHHEMMNLQKNNYNFD